MEIELKKANGIVCRIFNKIVLIRLMESGVLALSTQVWELDELKDPLCRDIKIDGKTVVYVRFFRGDGDEFYINVLKTFKLDEYVSELLIDGRLTSVVNGMSSLYGRQIGAGEKHG